MSAEHDEQKVNLDARGTDGLGIEASRRHFLQFSAATSAAAVSGLVPSVAFAGGKPVAAGHGDRPASMPTKYLIDCHCHLGSGPTVAELALTIHSARDWGALRTSQPGKFAKAVSEGAVDDSAVLLATMDKYGVTHAIVQTAPGKGTSNQMVLDAAKKSKGRFFPIYRPEAVTNATAQGTVGAGYANENSKVVRQIADELQSAAMSATLGVGEIVPITNAIHPVEINRDIAPIMFPTGYSGWKGAHYYIFRRSGWTRWQGLSQRCQSSSRKWGDPSARRSMPACLTMAMRNANIYFDMTDTSPAHLREAISVIGAERIMFGSDLSVISSNYSIIDNLKTMTECQLSAEEREHIAWKTANQVYKLGLKGRAVAPHPGRDGIPAQVQRAPENFLSTDEIGAVDEGRQDFLRKSFLEAEHHV